MGWRIGAASACALVAAAFLHTVPDRATAGWLVVLLVPWGLCVGSVRTENRSWTALLSVALVLRWVQVGAVPTLSDDLYRYLFEGLALNQGHNPFLESPAALTSLDPVLAAQVNHAAIPSIYPPVAQLWFRLLALFGTHAAVAQLATGTLDLANVALIRRLTPAHPWAAWAYAVHPVAILESAHGAHLETLAVLCCLGTVWAIENRRTEATVLLSLGAGVKLLPVLFVPATLRALGFRRTALGLGIGAGLLLVLALPVLDAGPALFTALRTYSASWSFNGFLHPLLEATVGGHARAVLGALGLVVAIVAARLPARQAWWLVGTGFLLLSPTVHPWYTSWALVPALLLGRRDWVYGATALQGSYFVLTTLDPTDGSWAPPGWLGLATWGPALLALGYYALKDARPTAP